MDATLLQKTFDLAWPPGVTHWPLTYTGGVVMVQVESLVTVAGVAYSSVVTNPLATDVRVDLTLIHLWKHRRGFGGGRKQSSSFSTDKQWFSLKVWQSLNSRQRQNKENWLLTVEARNNYLLYYVYLWCCFLSVFLYFPNLSVCLRLGMKKNVSKVRIFDSRI